MLIKMLIHQGSNIKSPYDG